MKQSPIDIAVSLTQQDAEIYPMRFEYTNPWKEAKILKIQVLPTRVVNKGKFKEYTAKKYIDSIETQHMEI